MRLILWIRGSNTKYTFPISIVLINFLIYRVTCKMNKHKVAMPIHECKLVMSFKLSLSWYLNTAWIPMIPRTIEIRLKDMWTNFCTLCVAATVL